MHVGNERAVRRLMGEVPVVYVIFDLLWLEGHSTLALPYRERRKLLDELGPHGPSWQTPAARRGRHRARRRDETTRPRRCRGRVSTACMRPAAARSWLKLKNHNSQSS
jgi:bifunctional non-homologous end joining protein LigD